MVGVIVVVVALVFVEIGLYGNDGVCVVVVVVVVGFLGLLGALVVVLDDDDDLNKDGLKMAMPTMTMRATTTIMNKKTRNNDCWGFLL